MPSHRVPYMPQYGETYCSFPRNSIAQRDSICSISPSLYDQALGPSPADKRRSMRDDTMWHLFEWQQRQAYARQPGLYNNMSSPKTMMNLSEHAVPMHSIPPSPSHGSLSMYGGYSPMRSYSMLGARSEVSSPIYRRDLSFERRQRPQYSKVSLNVTFKCQKVWWNSLFYFFLCRQRLHLKFFRPLNIFLLKNRPNGTFLSSVLQYAYTPERRSMPVGIPVQTITAQSLQTKTVSHDLGRLALCPSTLWPTRASLTPVSEGLKPRHSQLSKQDQELMSDLHTRS